MQSHNKQSMIDNDQTSIGRQSSKFTFKGRNTIGNQSKILEDNLN